MADQVELYLVELCVYKCVCVCMHMCVCDAEDGIKHCQVNLVLKMQLLSVLLGITSVHTHL